MAVAVELKDSSNDVCNLCYSAICDELRLGEKFRLKDLVVHYFCVLLSYSTPQQGNDNDGLRGFLYKDIKKEILRSSKILCHFCKVKGASVKCFKCSLQFHLLCGINNNAMSIFKDEFPTFCVSHRPKQMVPKKIMEEITRSPPSCTICFDAINIDSPYQYLWAPCCKKTWYHRSCVQKSALNQASLFKCAVCSDNRKFNSTMIKYGIFIPERDAAWESEPNAYQALLERHNQCDCPQCDCPYGRRADREGSRWEIILCGSCGAVGTHIACSKLKFSQTDWECQSCSIIPSSQMSKLKSRITVSDLDSFYPPSSSSNDKSPSSSTESFNDKEEPEDNAAKTKCNTDLKKSDGIEPSASNSKPSIETNYIPANREDGTAVIKNKGPVAQANAVDQIYNVTSPTTSLRESNSECKEIAIQQSNEDELVDVVNTPSTTPNSSPSKDTIVTIDLLDQEKDGKSSESQKTDVQQAIERDFVDVVNTSEDNVEPMGDIIVVDEDDPSTHTSSPSKDPIVTIDLSDQEKDGKSCEVKKKKKKKKRKKRDYDIKILGEISPAKKMCTDENDACVIDIE